MPTTIHLNVALVLPRGNEATFLAGNWAERQWALSQSDGLFDTYGASSAAYQSALTAVQNLGLSGLDSSNSNYVSSASPTS